MKDINEALKIRNLLELVYEITIREKLINEMVGTLYPEILRSEIIKLQKLHADILAGKPIQGELL